MEVLSLVFNQWWWLSCCSGLPLGAVTFFFTLLQDVVPVYFHNYEENLFPAKGNQCSATHGERPPPRHTERSARGGTCLHPPAPHLVLLYPPFSQVSLPPFFQSPLAFPLPRVRCSSLRSPRRVLQGNLNQATHIKSQAGETNRIAEQMQPGCQPTLSCCGWSAALCSRSKWVTWNFSFPPPQPALNKQRKGTACHGSGVKLGKQVLLLLTFPP